jgi:hypothetical protein
MPAHQLHPGVRTDSAGEISHSDTGRSERSAFDRTQVAPPLPPSVEEPVFARVQPTPPPFIMASSKPMLTGAGSVFNLSGTCLMDEPIAGLMMPDTTFLDEASELLPAYMAQAEYIFDQAEQLVDSADKIIRLADTSKVIPYLIFLSHEMNAIQKNFCSGVVVIIMTVAYCTLVLPLALASRSLHDSPILWLFILLPLAFVALILRMLLIAHELVRADRKRRGGEQAGKRMGATGV